MASAISSTGTLSGYEPLSQRREFLLKCAFKNCWGETTVRRKLDEMFESGGLERRRKGFQIICFLLDNRISYAESLLKNYRETGYGVFFAKTCKGARTTMVDEGCRISQTISSLNIIFPGDRNSCVQRGIERIVEIDNLITTLSLSNLQGLGDLDRSILFNSSLKVLEMDVSCLKVSEICRLFSAVAKRSSVVEFKVYRSKIVVTLNDKKRSKLEAAVSELLKNNNLATLTFDGFYYCQEGKKPLGYMLSFPHSKTGCLSISPSESDLEDGLESLIQTNLENTNKTLQIDKSGIPESAEEKWVKSILTVMLKNRVYQEVVLTQPQQTSSEQAHSSTL